MSAVADAIAPHLFPGCRVAISDGTGAPVGLGPDLAEAARSVGGVELMLGWCFEAPVDLDDAAAFPIIRAFMPGNALRAASERGRVAYLPSRLGALPALLHGPLRPDVIIASARRTAEGLAYGTAMSWLPAALEASDGPLLVEVNSALPVGSLPGTFPEDRAIVISETDRPPTSVGGPDPDEESLALARNVASLMFPGAAIQIGPGRLADAILDAIEVPVHIDSGSICDGVAGLDRRGLLADAPSTAYAVGSEVLYAWMDGRATLGRVEHTHDVSRLAGRDFMAINAALEIDLLGQVNVERGGPRLISGVGGHGDYALAASRSHRGLSIVALPMARRGRSTLVEQLGTPVSTAYPDIDVVVTALGVADLRGISPEDRAERIGAIWS